MHRGHSLPSPRSRLQAAFDVLAMVRSRWSRRRKLREAGPDSRHLWAETCIDNHFCGHRCRTNNEACCCHSRMETATKRLHFTPRIGGVAGGLWRFATTQLGGAHALARISGFPAYLRLYFRIFCFRTFVVCQFLPMSNIVLCFFSIFTVFCEL